MRANISGEEFGHPWKYLSHQRLEEACGPRKRNRREVFPTSLFGPEGRSSTAEEAQQEGGLSAAELRRL